MGKPLLMLTMFDAALLSFCCTPAACDVPFDHSVQSLLRVS
jgi:hypothetical protein